MNGYVGAPYTKGSETSKAGAEHILPKAGTLRAKVLDYITEHGPVTDEDISRGLKIDTNTSRPRRNELAKAGLIQEQGKRKNPSGVLAVAWVRKWNQELPSGVSKQGKLIF